MLGRGQSQSDQMAGALFCRFLGPAHSGHTLRITNSRKAVQGNRERTATKCKATQRSTFVAGTVEPETSIRAGHITKARCAADSRALRLESARFTPRPRRSPRLLPWPGRARVPRFFFLPMTQISRILLRRANYIFRSFFLVIRRNSPFKES